MIKVAYIIKWRELDSFRVQTGLKRYASLDEAVRQIDKWSAEFPGNRYYVELKAEALLY
jgi:hypothetical protein